MFAQPGLPRKAAALNFPQKLLEQKMEPDERQKISSHDIGMGLDALSIEELAERIQLLEAEILRLRAAIAAKGQSRQAAEAAFKF